jgi:hypothetical protein
MFERAQLVTALMLSLATAPGCTPVEPDTRQPPTATPVATCTPQSDPVRPQAGAGFDGHAAMAWVEAIVRDGTDLRPRTPTHHCHGATANWLEQAMQTPGWEVYRQAFAGTDYAPLPKGAAQHYETACGPVDRAEVAGIQFVNLWARRPGMAEDRTLLIGAHWDAKEDATGGGVSARWWPTTSDCRSTWCSRSSTEKMDSTTVTHWRAASTLRTTCQFPSIA